MKSAAKPVPASRAAAARQDGWTADRQRRFLAAVAEGHTVGDACKLVGLSVASAYAFRRRASGQAFALGWAGASLLARDRLADELMARAIDGQVDTYTKADGSTVTRHRHDNRLAVAMLARLDRLAEGLSAEAQGLGACGQAAPARPVAAAIVAGDWEPYLDEVVSAEADDGAAAFLASRTPDEDAFEPQLPQLRGRRRRAEAEYDDEEEYDEDEDEDFDDDDFEDDDDLDDDDDAPGKAKDMLAGIDLDDERALIDNPKLTGAVRERIAARARTLIDGYWGDAAGNVFTRHRTPADFTGTFVGMIGYDNYCRQATPRETLHYHERRAADAAEAAARAAAAHAAANASAAAKADAPPTSDAAAHGTAAASDR